MATPQPEPSEHLRKDSPPLSATGSASGASLPDAVWLTVCAWCERAKLRGRWVTLERALIAYRDARDLSLTHGICPSCFAVAMRSADKARRQQRSA